MYSSALDWLESLAVKCCDFLGLAQIFLSCFWLESLTGKVRWKVEIIIWIIMLKKIDFCLIHLGYLKCCWNDIGVGRICLNYLNNSFVIQAKTRNKKILSANPVRRYQREMYWMYLDCVILVDRDMWKDSDLKLLCSEPKNRLTINLSPQL